MMRYHHAASVKGYRYVTINEKAMTLQVTASYQVRSNVCDVAITDTLQVGVVSFEAAHRLLCAMCRILARFWRESKLRFITKRGLVLNLSQFVEHQFGFLPCGE